MATWDRRDLDGTSREGHTQRHSPSSSGRGWSLPALNFPAFNRSSACRRGSGTSDQPPFLKTDARNRLCGAGSPGPRARSARCFLRCAGWHLDRSRGPVTLRKPGPAMQAHRHREGVGLDLLPHLRRGGPSTEAPGPQSCSREKPFTGPVSCEGACSTPHALSPRAQGCLQSVGGRAGTQAGGHSSSGRFCEEQKGRPPPPSPHPLL